MSDNPTHYGKGLYEAINVIEAWDFGFSLGNALKYLCRTGKKGDRLEDLRKALWYLNREIANEIKRRESADMGIPITEQVSAEAEVDPPPRLNWRRLSFLAKNRWLYHAGTKETFDAILADTTFFMGARVSLGADARIEVVFDDICTSLHVLHGLTETGDVYRVKDREGMKYENS